MEQDYWRTRWDEGRTGWHEIEGTPALVRHLARLELGPGRRVLVPLAGKSHDLAVLGATGAEVVGVELVEDAALAFFIEHGISPERAVVHGRPVLRAGALHIVCGDFFAESPATIGLFDAVFDRAALVAMPPALRPRYAGTVRRLARPGAPMLVVTFEHDAGGDEPPFSVVPAELPTLYPGVSFEPLEEREAFDAKGGLAARGATFTRERAFLARLG